MKTLLKLSQMLLGGGALLLFAGGLPRLGVPAVYQSGAMLLLGILGTALALWGGLRLAQSEIKRFGLGFLYTILSASGLYTAIVMSQESWRAFHDSSESGLITFVYIDCALMGLFCLGFFAYKSALTMTKKHWLAMAHLSFVPLAAGAYLDYSFEITSRMPVLVSQETMTKAVLTADGKEIPLGFELSLSQFELEYYEDDDFVIYEQQNDVWNPLGAVQDRGGRLYYGHESWPKSDLEYLPQLDNKPIMLVKGTPPRIILQKEPTIKEYRLQYSLTDPAQEKPLTGTLRVNEPIEHKGWQFSLMNYRKAADSDATMVQLEVRHAPGRLWARLGMIALIISIAAWCWYPLPPQPSSKS